MAKKRKKSLQQERYCWCICYINRDFLPRVEEELMKYEYDIETYIPTVRVIKKKFKGKDVFELIPMLFNYGFFKIPYKDACNPEYLMQLRQRVTAIYGWVKDPANAIRHNLKIRRDNGENHIAMPASAFASDKEIAHLIETADQVNIFSAEEIMRFKVGDYIQLKGYPFENMPAKILEINTHKKDIKVELQMDALVKEMTVSFENVFYTVYQNGYDDSLSNDINLDEIDTYSTNSVDKLTFDNHYFQEDEQE